PDAKAPVLPAGPITPGYGERQPAVIGPPERRNPAVRLEHVAPISPSMGFRLTRGFVKFCLDHSVYRDSPTCPVRVTYGRGAQTRATPGRGTLPIAIWGVHMSDPSFRLGRRAVLQGGLAVSVMGGMAPLARAGQSTTRPSAAAPTIAGTAEWGARD